MKCDVAFPSQVWNNFIIVRAPESEVQSISKMNIFNVDDFKRRWNVNILIDFWNVIFVIHSLTDRVNHTCIFDFLNAFHILGVKFGNAM